MTSGGIDSAPTLPLLPIARMDVLGSIATVFDRAGFEIFLVGGSVRDRLLGRPFEDLDLATNARPPDIKRLLKQAKPDGIYEIGAKFGTIGATFAGTGVEGHHLQKRVVSNRIAQAGSGVR